MIVIFLLVLGAVTGWWRAARMGGARADRLQYAAAHAMAFTALGLLVSVLIARMS